ncbi:MAG: hypothetical protein ACUVXA_13300 [Candidatus Jordarchaeum sp.]|uniref:hypothetical protein n=1 Tax=Candidatus Jordarchaeum sp. TaxID=2823881 RepID=UPI00404B5025
MTENERTIGREVEPAEREVKPSRPTRPRPKRRVLSTGFKEFSGKMLPITMIILGLAIIFTSIAYIITRETVQYWLLIRSPNLIGFVLVNMALFPFLITRIAAICFAGAGLMLAIYGFSFYFPEERSEIQRISMIAGFLLGSIYLLLLSIAGIQLTTIWLYDQVMFQMAFFGLPINLSTGFWQYLLLVAAILLLMLTLVKWIIPNAGEATEKIVFPLGTIAVWLLALTEWTKLTLATSQLAQFASITLLPSSLFMGEPMIEGAALIALGIGMILKLTMANEKESIRYVFTAMAALVYGIALVHQVLLLWAFSLTVFWLIAIILAVVAGIFIVFNGVIYFKDCAEKI